jgi:hypothetical protein
MAVIPYFLAGHSPQTPELIFVDFMRAVEKNCRDKELGTIEPNRTPRARRIGIGLAPGMAYS